MIVKNMNEKLITNPNTNIDFFSHVNPVNDNSYPDEHFEHNESLAPLQ